MNTRTVEFIASPPPVHWVGDGFRVHNFIPSAYHLRMERMNPFIFMDYNSQHPFEPSDKPKGVDVHPHRGFETVTIAYKGKVEHGDSHGGGGIIEEGDVQWMTAASGILHKEHHEKEWSKKGGVFQMVQLWINLPAKDKMSAPKYQAIKNADMNRYILDHTGSEVEVIAGEYKKVKGTASTFTPIHIYNAKLNKGAEMEVDFPSNYNTALLVVEGSISLNETEKVPTNHLALMENDGEKFTIKTFETSKILVLSGEPIHEPIVAHGPFVMNSEHEIMQAFEDFNNGKFGVLEN